MEKRTIKIDNIVVKNGIQQRAQLNEDCVEEYAEEISNGTIFPPLVVYDDGENLILADGWHRYEAYRLSEVEDIEVFIYKGTERDAILHAVGANADHGLRRTNADKRKAATTLLMDEEWNQSSDGKIANICRVSQPFVSKIRNELTQNGFEFKRKRIGANGVAIDTSNIGARSSDSKVTEETGETGAPELTVAEPEADEITEKTDPESDDSSSEVEHTDDSISHSDDTESVGAAVNDEMAAETSNEENMSAYTDDLNEMIKEPKRESALMGSESNSTPESDDQTNANETVDNSMASEVDDYQSQSDEIPELGDVQPSEGKISELEKIIKEKDQRISELETENAKLKARIRELEVQADVSDDYEGLITDIEPDKEFAY